MILRFEHHIETLNLRVWNQTPDMVLDPQAEGQWGQGVNLHLGAE